MDPHSSLSSRALCCCEAAFVVFFSSRYSRSKNITVVSYACLPYYLSSEKYNINLYGADEYGTLSGVEQMMAEIYTRGPIACLLNSEPPEFNNYKGGIIDCPEHAPLCNLRQYNDHVIVIAGWGVDAATGKEYWVGRNSYGTKVRLVDDLRKCICVPLLLRAEIMNDYKPVPL
jgi:hypothetical protein